MLNGVAAKAGLLASMAAIASHEDVVLWCIQEAFLAGLGACWSRREFLVISHDTLVLRVLHIQASG